MEGKHTPGPWHLEDDGTIRSKEIGASNLMADYCGSIVCSLRPAVGVTDSDKWPSIGRPHAMPEAMANARLIAAAPDLLAICKKMARLMEYVPDLTGLINPLAIKAEAEAIISKATQGK
jgi:hypothetical protein